MNVHLYVLLVVAIGLVLSYRIGRGLKDSEGWSKFFAFSGLSFVLGIALAFPLLMLVINICAELGLNDRQCINTDDRTVWGLALPLVAMPLYFFSMAIGRSMARPEG